MNTRRSPPRKKDNVDSFDNRSGFYFLQARFCPGLSGKKTEMTESKADNISIGSFDARRFALVTSIFVGHKDRLFDQKLCGEADYTTSQFIIGDVRVVMLNSFLTLPAKAFGSNVPFHDLLEMPKHLGISDRMKTGLTEGDCCRLFVEARKNLFAEYASKIIQLKSYNPQMLQAALRIAIFMPRADMKDRMYRKLYKKSRPFDLDEVLEFIGRQY